MSAAMTVEPSAAPRIERLLGTWRMLAWTRELLATGERSDAFGADPVGYITYGADGRVMVLVVKSDRQPPRALVATPEEKLALYDSLFGYAGTYSFDGKKVVHHIDVSWNQAWTGTDQIRFCTLDGTRLTYVGAPARDPGDGQECVYTVTFEKIS
jgi:hypothetical protein